MPELPDLQVFSRNLNKWITGKKIRTVNIPVTNKLKVSAAKFKQALTGKTITKVYREGKELYIAFTEGHVLSLHLMLHGDLYFFEGRNENKNTIIDLLFDDDSGIALTDWQRMATPTLNPEKRDTPDALSKSINYSFLKQELHKKRTAIKSLLIDQKFIRGIGNAYADEILWDALISPFSVSNRIPDKKIRILAKSIRKVLTNAEKQILKSHPDIINGEIRDFLLIHHSKRAKSPTGAVIHTKVAGSRKTYYTDEQELFQ